MDEDWFTESHSYTDDSNVKIYSMDEDWFTESHSYTDDSNVKIYSMDRTCSWNHTAILMIQM